MGKQWWLLLTTVSALTCFLSFLPFSSAFGVSSHAFLTVRSSREGIGRNYRPLYLVPETTALVAAATVAGATAERADVYLQHLGLSLVEHGGVGILVINALLFSYYSNLKETLLSGIKGWRSDTNASVEKLSVESKASFEKLSVESKASIEKLSASMDASMEKLSASIEKLSDKIEASNEKLVSEMEALHADLEASIDASIEKLSD
jgi:ribosome-associated translation inhibitor RaiA